MKLNAKGIELYNKWETIYYAELDKLRKKYNDPDYFEGWCIIDNFEHIKTLEDEVGLFVLGYENDLPWMFEDWKNDYGKNDEFFRDADGNSYTLEDFIKACMPYLEN